MESSDNFKIAKVPKVPKVPPHIIEMSLTFETGALIRKMCFDRRGNRIVDPSTISDRLRNEEAIQTILDGKGSPTFCKAVLTEILYQPKLTCNIPANNAQSRAVELLRKLECLG